jgi:hypothetical protein
MFDVAGLPKREGSRSSRCLQLANEFNVCYDVEGRARAWPSHPIARRKAWAVATARRGFHYHLNEGRRQPEEERRVDAATRARSSSATNEVHIVDGHVTLFCLFDPAPTGVERHRPGAYSDYEPLSQVLGTTAYETHKQEIARYDRMVDQLSMAKARDGLDEVQGTAAWELYLEGREAQAAIEGELVRTMATEGGGRQRVVQRWMQSRVESPS